MDKRGDILPYIYTHGSGTENDPYQVWTAEDLDGVRDHLDKHFIQKVDINMEDWEYGDPFIPIGNWSTRFSGNFNGDNFKVNNLYVRGIDWDSSGLFGVAGNGAYISNIILVDPISTAEEDSAGGIVGYTWVNAGEPTVIIENCHIKTSIEGVSTISVRSIGEGLGVGGIVGNAAHNTTIRKCNVDGNIIIGHSASQYGQNAGGIAGYLGGRDACLIEECYISKEVTVEGKERVGGIVGYLNGGTIKNCYTRCIDILGKHHIGGICGSAVTSSLGPKSKLEYCYSASDITIASGGTNYGGILGSNPDSSDTEIINCYYDSDVCGLSDTGKGIPKTTAEMVYPYSDPENVYINWAFYGEDEDPVWQHDMAGLKYDVTTTITNFIIDTCLVHGPDRSFTEYRYLASLLYQDAYFDGSTLYFGGYDVTAHIKDVGGATYLPIRYIAQDLFGLKVDYDEVNAEVDISGHVSGPINDGYPHFIRGLIKKYRYLMAIRGGTVTYL